MTGELVTYDKALYALRQALEHARTVTQARNVIFSAKALEDVARKAKDKSAQVDAAEIRFRAERHLGALIAAQKATVGLNQGTRGQLRGKTISGGSLVVPPEDPAARLAEAGIDKKLSARAQKVAAVALDQFEQMLAEWRARVNEETDRITTNLLRFSEQKQTRKARPSKPLPVGEFHLLYADPPWRYEHVETYSRAIENQYPTMSLEELCALAVPAASDAVLFLWATSPKLAEAMHVITAWGFVYRTCAVWDKGVIGMGYYFRQQHELLLVAGRGQAPVPEPADRPPSVLRVKRGTHSTKPTEVYEWIERMYPRFAARDRVELFARAARPGWTVWTNEPAA